MYNIAVINHEKLSRPDYISNLEKRESRIHLIGIEDLAERVHEMDAIIIGNQDSDTAIVQTCEAIIKTREYTSEFIWVLSKHSTKVNRIVYLQLGCDGIFDEQIDSEEFSLLATSVLARRLETKMLKKQNGSPNIFERSKNTSRLQLKPHHFSVNIAGRGEIHLTKLEFKLLDLLHEYKGEAVPYDKLFEAIWGDKNGDKQYRIANLIFNLRKKIEGDSGQYCYIKTIRSRGYMLNV